MRESRLSRNRDTGMVRLYAWAMIVTTGLAVVAALHVTRIDPRYSASAEVVVAPTITPSGNYIQPSMPTEQRVATSTGVISDAAERLGVPAELAAQHVSVTVPVDTQILVLAYTADTPTAAQSGAKALAQAYLQARKPKNAKNAVASLVSPPELPSAPLGVNYPLILGAAVLGGLLTGFAVARAWDWVRGRIRTISDAEEWTDLDALAMTPRLPSTSIKAYRRMAAGHSQLDALAARVLAEVDGKKRSTVLVTGAASECGTTGVAVLTALALARMGRVVVLVTADDQVIARWSRDRDSQQGPKEQPRERWPVAQASEQEGLHLVSVADWDGAGVAAARLTKLVPALHRRVPEALILIDGPPAWCSAGMALRVDKILLVVALGSSRRSAAAAVHVLYHCAEKIMGFVATPPRGHVRKGLASVRARADLRHSPIGIGSSQAGAGPASARQPHTGTTPDPDAWTDSAAREDHRGGAATTRRNGNVDRHLPVPRPTGEPTTSGLS